MGSAVGHGGPTSMPEDFYAMKIRPGMFPLMVMLLFLLPLINPTSSARADGEIPEEIYLEALVVEILEELYYEVEGYEGSQLYQQIRLRLLQEPRAGQEVTIEVGTYPVLHQVRYEAGDKVIVILAHDYMGEESAYIVDFVRRDPLLLLLGLFVLLAILVAGIKGVTSLAGMAFSFLVIFVYILPRILDGHNPVTASITGAMVIVPITFLLSHGVNRKTLVAIVGTAIALIVTGVLAGFAVDEARLSGFASEEAGFLHYAGHGRIDMKGLLLAGIIIGLLGVLDDITVSQSAIVFKLKSAHPAQGFRRLYGAAMDVGKDHIASMVNTLILVYTGAALPLLLLFLTDPRPVLEIINYEMIAEEIVRMLVGSMGLILAVPVTTLLACLVAEGKFTRRPETRSVPQERRDS